MNRFPVMRCTEAVDYPGLPTWQSDYYPQLRDTGEDMVRAGIVLLGTGLFCLFLQSLVSGQRK